jgi:hypothetical protein
MAIERVRPGIIGQKAGKGVVFGLTLSFFPPPCHAKPLNWGKADANRETDTLAEGTATGLESGGALYMDA